VTVLEAQRIPCKQYLPTSRLLPSWPLQHPNPNSSPTSPLDESGNPFKQTRWTNSSLHHFPPSLLTEIHSSHMLSHLNQVFPVPARSHSSDILSTYTYFLDHTSTLLTWTASWRPTPITLPFESHSTTRKGMAGTTSEDGI
jgi:hypothetical protein